MQSNQAEMPSLRVEIKALRVDGKKLKRALFRQIPLRSIIGADGEIFGTPLGFVNYFPGGGMGGCTHVVWHDGGRLYRDLLYNPSTYIPESIANTIHLDARYRPRLSTSASLHQASDEVRAALRKAKESYAEITRGLQQLYIGV